MSLVSFSVLTWNALHLKKSTLEGVSLESLLVICLYINSPSYTCIFLDHSYSLCKHSSFLLFCCLDGHSSALTETDTLSFLFRLKLIEEVTHCRQNGSLTSNRLQKRFRKKEGRDVRNEWMNLDNQEEIKTGLQEKKEQRFFHKEGFLVASKTWLKYRENEIRSPFVRWREG